MNIHGYKKCNIIDFRISMHLGQCYLQETTQQAVEL